MTFLLVSAVMFMLSSSVVEYAENIKGHSVYKTTITVDTTPIVKSDTSTTKHLVPSTVTATVDCRDFSSDKSLDVSLIDISVSNEWLLALHNLDHTGALLLNTLGIETAHAVCQQVLGADRYYKQQLKSERKV